MSDGANVRELALDARQVYNGPNYTKWVIAERHWIMDSAHILHFVCRYRARGSPVDFALDCRLSLFDAVPFKCFNSTMRFLYA